MRYRTSPRLLMTVFALCCGAKDGPYEPPVAPDLEFGADVPVEDAVERLVEALQRQ